MTALIKPILGVADTFGARARQLRGLQMSLLALYEQSGFDEVIPPLLERPQTLEAGSGRYLADQMLVFSDPADAGQLALRPDMTPQVARIAATRLQSEPVLKLCYSGPVLLARPDARTSSREQWQTGVEYLGEASVEGDVEVIHLAAMSMHTAGFDAPLLQVGHMGLVISLLEGSRTAIESWTRILARRSPDDMRAYLQDESLPEANQAALIAMAAGGADRAWLEENLGRISPAFDAAANELIQLVDTVCERLQGEVDICIDAAVMPRFLYHSGIVFTGFAAGATQALLHGGRYDAMMASHGRDMPATGFSCDLWAWLDAGAQA